MAARGKDVVDAGGVVVEILQTAYFAEPTQDQLDAWINTHDLTVTTVMDRDPDAETETFNALGIREQAFILDLTTMQIVWQNAGSILGQGDPSAKLAIDQILTRLAQ